LGSVCRIKPPISDDREQHAALVERLANPATEIVPIPDGIDIQKERVTTEAAFEVIEDSAYDVGAVLAPIGEKDLSHCRKPGITRGIHRQWSPCGDRILTLSAADP
jgi:hypothetical protein